ncbi:hypothetical protein PPSIR1_19819 [Plesiocystis pacifica SIR-1]|uniref:Uncharacterized protein n=1 Tax=Plesiocystis pacifica SIR-1 TaxID=391625 RepID=A6GDR6_9BACT|nr:hypothetical protein [Plesiocystis pacifica]EDM75955.1 hypothetical protein PPSIR1_19819 [Plesiocystis pacifica SIR-1]
MAGARNSRQALRAAFAGLLGLSAWALAPARAQAGNELHVRTPVLWPGASCGQVVERGGSEDAALHLDYAIPAEDTLLTADELEDSRTHQFLALCRDRPSTELLPEWITADDLARSLDAGLLDAAEAEAIISDLGILDAHPEWSSCARRITADDDRRPITFAAAEAGVDWTLADVPVGVWRVAGYTFEPPLNLWSPRPGFIKIVDDLDDPEQDLPALALSSPELILEADGAFTLEGCADLLEPALASVDWSPFAPELDWRPLLEAEAITDGSFSLALTAPPLEALGPPGRDAEASDQPTLLLRVRVTDALGRSAVAHLSQPAQLRPCVGGCADDSGSDSGEDGESGSHAGCSVPETPRPRLLWLLLALGWMGRRKGRTTRARFFSSAS